MRVVNKDCVPYEDDPGTKSHATIGDTLPDEHCSVAGCEGDEDERFRGRRFDETKMHVSPARRLRFGSERRARAPARRASEGRVPAPQPHAVFATQGHADSAAFRARGRRHREETRKPAPPRRPAHPSPASPPPPLPPP